MTDLQKFLQGKTTATYYKLADMLKKEGIQDGRYPSVDYDHGKGEGYYAMTFAQKRRFCKTQQLKADSLFDMDLCIGSEKIHLSFVVTNEKIGGELRLNYSFELKEESAKLFSLLINNLKH